MTRVPGATDGIEGVKTDIRNLATMMEAFRHRHGRYPADFFEVRATWPSHEFHGGGAEVESRAEGFRIAAWNSALLPGPHRCTMRTGSLAMEAGVESGRLIVE